MDGEAYVRALNAWIAREGKRLAERNPVQPASLTLHHLYYLLSRFDDVLEVQTGPLNVRLQDIGEEHHAHASDTYVSFSKRNSDAASIKSVSSIRSVMSTAVSTVWTGLGLWGGTARSEQQVTEDLKLLYSAFCKIPSIRLAPDAKLKPISGFEEYPFDTCVPLLAFKNLQGLEVFDYPITALTGWDELSEQLRSLVIKRSGLVDVAKLTRGIIQDEHERKRRKAERATRHWQTLNNTIDGGGSPRPGLESRSGSANGHFSQSMLKFERPRSASPTLTQAQTRPGSARGRHASMEVPFVLSSTKWRFLRFLSLSDNGLTYLTEEALAPLHALSFLDLSKNKFTSVPKALATCTHLRSLDLSHNLIDNLRTLLVEPIPGIATLNLRANKLVDLCGIERLPSIERLDLRDNAIKDVAECARLAQAPGLCDLYVAGNPFAARPEARLTIFNLLRQNPIAPEGGDVCLDGKRPGLLEKRSLVARAAENMPGTPARSETRQGAAAATLQVKKKTHKSRRIDLHGEDGGAASDASGQSPLTSPSNTTKLTASRTASYGAEGSDAYRRKIEQLKQEVGPGWLRVMNDAQTSERKTVAVDQD
ncbi:hypothetical protein BCR37DRAFT_348496 [Protomyces lactucae-debilis]|uniref:Uncharacterized protein n=1 Tax=Protomyces lactucae-debilis TaxID=2754530 RepID=A0A1Y2FD60_PROLT|nr:uncharacterized protein BCR37DRAFT_348496 [Protomyces lactucae-debilis]ORY80785.1 hypothetical protein BCR37DRAFT_348496 [Protomyces lactucae-debilis]